MYASAVLKLHVLMEPLQYGEIRLVDHFHRTSRGTVGPVDEPNMGIGGGSGIR